MLHRLRDRELDIHLPAVSEHDDEEREPAAGVAHRNGTPASPVDLRTLAGSEVEFEIDGQLGLPDAADVVAQDRDAAAISLFAQALENLLRAVGVRVEQAGNAALERIEDAVARLPLLGCVAWTRQPLDNGLAVKTERARDLGDGQSLTIAAVVDLGERLVVDHSRGASAPSGWRRGRPLRHGENVLAKA